MYYMDFINDNIYFLNIAELKNICQNLNIDYYYYIEKNNSLIRGRIDKKINIIRNILRVLHNKNSKISIIPCNVVSFDKITNLTKKSKVYYRQYINGNKKIYNLMIKLTNQQFKFGVIAQDILYDHWKKGILLTYEQLADKWLKYDKKIHPEWRFIEFVRQTGTIKGWKTYRKKMAILVIKKILKEKN